MCVFIELAPNWRSDEQRKTSASVQKHRKLERAENIPVWTHEHTAMVPSVSHEPSRSEKNKSISQ